MSIDILSQIKRAAFVLDEKLLIQNLKLMQRVQQEADVSIILALKGFAMWKVFPLIKKYLGGATASSLNEARLIYDEMGCRAHTYCVAFLPDEFEEILKYSDFLTFNSISEFKRYFTKVKKADHDISMGLRVNPEFSPVKTELYNPASPQGRLGVLIENLPDVLPPEIEGLHLHTLCESTSYDFEKLISVFEEKFGKFLKDLKWVNFGGGHLMTHEAYDVEHLIQILKKFKSKYPHLEVILEPGSAVALNTGVLVANVLDIQKSRGVETLIVDVSFTAHMPDTLEMPYKPKIRNASDPKPYLPTYRVGSTSCLAGDFMMEYSFEQEVRVGDSLIFEDMMHYTMVKTTMFNGIRHPDICVLNSENELEIVKKFEFVDFRDRLS